MAKHTYIALVNDDACYDWLRSSLASMGDLVRISQETWRDALQLIPATGAAIAFVEVSYGKGISLIEELVACAPGLAVVAIGPSDDSALVLSAMRAGASDYLNLDMPSLEFLGLLRRLEQRIPLSPANNALPDGDLVSIFSARPDVDTSSISAHMALLLQQKYNRNTLLLDLGACTGDSLNILGIEARYTFNDALSNLHRMDEKLIGSAFSMHSSGLTVMPVADDATGTIEHGTVEILLLLGVLRQHFEHVVANLGGIDISDFLQLVLGRSNHQLLVVEQGVSGCRSNLRLCGKLREAKVLSPNAQLIVDRYSRKIPPDADMLADRFGMKLGAILPDNSEQRLSALNLGRNILDAAPSSPYMKSLDKLLNEIYTLERSRNGWLSQLLTGIRRGHKAADVQVN